MPTRLTQTARVSAAGVTSGTGQARITQIVRVPVASVAVLGGGRARLTQCARVVIGTRGLMGGGFMLKGLGS